MHPFASSFTAYCSKKTDSKHKKRSRTQFLELTSREPLRTIEIESTIVHLVYSDTAHLGIDTTGNIFVLLHGELYDVQDEPAQFLVVEYTRTVLAMAAGLHGSFALIIVDRVNDGVFLVTDRVNSRRVFWSRWAEGVCVTTSLASLPRDRFTLDPVGVAWYLSNGVVHAGRTVFEGVSVLERACVHKFKGLAFAGQRYWTFQPSAHAGTASRRALAVRLSEHLVSGVRRCLGDNPDLFLSLSGGYDSVGIGGILSDSLGLKNVRCVTYVHGDTRALSDADVAQQTAQALGYPCRTVQCYQDDFIQTLLDNAKMGDFQCPFVYEVDAWKVLAEELDQWKHPVLLVGDECFGWSDFHLRNSFEILACVQIRDFDCLQWLDGILPQETHEQFRRGIETDIQAILRRCPVTDDPHDTKDFLYLDQRLSNFILPLRERYEGRFLTIRPPLLDNDILDFMATVPSRIRCQKRLYRYTITRMFPRLFSIPRAARSDAEFDLATEIERHQSSIRELLVKRENPIDGLIPPDVILRLMDHLKKQRGEPVKPLTWKTRAYRTACFFLPLNVVEAARAKFPPPTKPVDPWVFLTRLLVLRLSLMCEYLEAAP